MPPSRVCDRPRIRGGGWEPETSTQVCSEARQNGFSSVVSSCYGIILSCREAPPVRIGYGLEAGQRCCDRVFEVWHEPGDSCGVYLNYLLESFPALFRHLRGKVGVYPMSVL